MSVRLSSELINQLTPVLGSSARMVARGWESNEGELSTLLFGAGLPNDDSAILVAIHCCIKLLDTVREQSSERQRMLTVEALAL